MTRGQNCDPRMGHNSQNGLSVDQRMAFLTRGGGDGRSRPPRKRKGRERAKGRSPRHEKEGAEESSLHPCKRQKWFLSQKNHVTHFESLTREQVNFGFYLCTNNRRNPWSKLTALLEPSSGRKPSYFFRNAEANHFSRPCGCERRLPPRIPQGCGPGHVHLQDPH
jgi:hypothetical protein